MTDIILIHPPTNLSVWEKKLGSKLPPIGLASLAGYLREKGVSVKIMDALNLGLSADSVLDYIKQNSPDYVGITATTNMITNAANLANRIKEDSPHITTIIGGAHVSALPEETIERFPSFDVGVFGEGEKTLYQLINTGKIDSTIKGIVYRNNGTVTKTMNRDYIKNLDELPFPAYDLLPDFPDYYRPTPNNYALLPVAPIISSRGCPFSCTFCDRAVFGQKWRAHSVDYLISLIKYLKDRYKLREICFYDDIFMLNKQRLYEFIEKKSKNQIDISWSCEGRIDQLDEQVLKDMKRAGCWQINYGIESGSQDILNDFNKKITVDQIQKTLTATKNAKMNARAYLIIGSPLENKDTLNETRELVLSAPLTDIHISFFAPLPGSDIYKRIFGNERVEDYNAINQYFLSYLPPQLSEDILNNYMSSLYKKFYFHPQRLFRYILMIFNRHKTIHLIRAGISFLILNITRKQK